MNFFALILFILIALSGFARAEDCARVRLDESGGPLENAPVTDQGDTPVCYDHAGALMMTGYLQKKNPQPHTFSVSPEKIWSQIDASPKNVSDQITSATNGRTCGAFNLAKTAGMCDRSKLLEIMNQYSSSQKNEAAGGSESDQMEYFKQSFEQFFSRSKKGDLNTACKKLKSSLQNLGVSEEEAKDLTEIALMADTDDMKNTGSKKAFFDTLLDSVCKSEGAWKSPIATESNTPPLCEKFDFVKAKKGDGQKLHSPQEFKKHLDQLLDLPKDQRLPVGIEYCSGILTDGPAAYIKNRQFPNNIDYLNSGGEKRNFKSNCGFHASVVIGRESRKGSCGYIIQNSWGTSCNYYRSPKNCKDGKVWVSEKDLSQNILRISQIKE